MKEATAFIYIFIKITMNPAIIEFPFFWMIPVWRASAFQWMLYNTIFHAARFSFIQFSSVCAAVFYLLGLAYYAHVFNRCLAWERPLQLLNVRVCVCTNKKIITLWNAWRLLRRLHQTLYAICILFCINRCAGTLNYELIIKLLWNCFE